MKHSELVKQFAGNEEAFGEFTVFLVDLDRIPDDELDVIISPVRELEIDAETKQIRLYSAASRPDSASEPLALLELFLDELPLPGVLPSDYDVVVEMPVSPADEPTQVPHLQPLKGVVIGRESEEIWLLVDEPAEYPADVLPT